MKIIGIDPGTTTGIALCSVFPEERDSKGTSLGGDSRDFGGDSRDFEVDATAEISGEAVFIEEYGEDALSDSNAWRWVEYYNALECVGWVDEHLPDLLVIEDFILQPGKQGEYRGGARAGLSPARIGAAVGVMLEIGRYECKVMWQGSSLISGLTGAQGQQRMKAKGLWVRGSEHKRDAVRHAYVGYGRWSAGTVRKAVGGSAGKRPATKVGARRVSKTVKKRAR